MNKMDKTILIYSGVFFISLLSTIHLTSLFADEGTHALLALFYKDMFTISLQNLDFSFKNLYDFGVSYLIHYPKLQVFYPPIYHFLTGLLFYPIFGISVFSARLVNIIMSTLSVITFYFVTKEFFNRKSAFIATLLFSLFPVTLWIGRMAMMEFTVVFFTLLSFYFYQKAWKNDKNKYYILTSIMILLAIMSKRAGFFLIPIYGLHILYRKKWKKLITFLIPVGILFIPYFLIFMKIGGFEVSSAIYSKYAFETPETWEYFFKFPFLLVLLFLFFYHNYKRRGKKENFFMIWFLIFFVGILLISFKFRYFHYFQIPVFMVAGSYFSKIKKRWLCLFLVGYVILSVYLTVQEWENYPQVEKISYEIYSTRPKNGNIAVFSEGGYRFSSNFAFYLARLDENKTIFLYRSCLFHNKTREEILDFFEKNNVFYVIAIPEMRGYENVNKIKENLELIESGPVELYKVKEFIPKQKEYCNYICLTEEEICTEYFSPYDVYKS